MERRSEPGWRSRCRVAATVVVVVACLVAGAGRASVANAGKEGNHCISPAGVDLNEFYGVSEQIVAPFCAQVGSGEQWTVAGRWLMNDTFKFVPKGFVPAGATPLEDFIAKFVGVRYVVDPGTNHEQTAVFPNGGNLFTGTQEGFVVVNTLTLGTLDPLPDGGHVVELYWSFTAMHCDGLGKVLADNCLPAGETLFTKVAFEVTPGHN
jgi:hypothetical protein